MTSLASFAKTLSESLHLTQPPIAVAFADQVPDSVRIFDGPVPAGCRFWQEATTQVFATLPKQHDLCSIGMYTHHLADGPGVAADLVAADLEDALKVFGDLGYVRPEDMPFIPRARPRRGEGGGVRTARIDPGEAGRRAVVRERRTRR